MGQLRSSAILACVCGLFPWTSLAQTPHTTTLNLVMPNAKGRIIISTGEGVKWQRVNLYDDGTRPVFLVSNDGLKLNVSYILFPNLTKSNSPNICRDDVLTAALRGLSPVPGFADTRNNKKAEVTLGNGSVLATGSYLVTNFGGTKVNDENAFGVQASSTVCAEVHVSKTGFTPADEPILEAQVRSFHFEPEYEATSQDYYTLAAIFFRVMKDFASAAVYYQRSLDTLPADAPLKGRRVLVDQLAMSYGMSGDLRRSRSVNETAIKSDPDYPLYYYNLACADAEEGKAQAAKLHLQQAFDRKANTIPGEHLPDPTQDDSIQKLEKNKEFWSWVQTLK